MEYRTATNKNKEAHRKAMYLSSAPCILCGTMLTVYDIHEVDKLLCGNCMQKKPALERNNYFRDTNMTHEQKIEALRNDNTVRAGGRANSWSPKNPHQFEVNHPDYGKVVK